MHSEMIAAAIPADFEPLDLRVGYMDLIGPIYRRRGSRGTVLGLRIEERHCNAAPIAHGGMLAGFADVVVSYALASSAVPSLPSLSISLNIEFFASAPRGAWLEGVATLQRVGNSIGFVSCDLKIDGDSIAHASSALKILRRR